MNSTTTNSTIKASNRKLKMKYLVTKEIRFEKFQTFLEQMKIASVKQNNMKTICQENQNKGKSYIFTHDPRLDLFDI